MKLLKKQNGSCISGTLEQIIEKGKWDWSNFEGVFENPREVLVSDIKKEFGFFFKKSNKKNAKDGKVQ